MSKHYEAKIVSLNAAKIGSNPHGTAKFTEDESTLTIKIEMFDTPANTQHFHGFLEGKVAAIATTVQDANGDGFVDLPETEPVSGTTMVPFDDAPKKMAIPNDAYPVSDGEGHFVYGKTVPLDKLQQQFKSAFGTTDLQLDKRVVYVHGVPEILELPDTVAGAVSPYDAHITLPIAVGKIEATD